MKNIPFDLPDTKHLKVKKGKIRTWWEGLPDQKKYIEFLAAILTIPVLITVIILNTNNLRNKDEDKQKEPTQIIVTQTSQPTANPQTCKKEIGPISIIHPTENQKVDDNPLSIIIRHDSEKYCSVVWSYRINDGSWSPYTSNSISLYNMESGEKRFQLRVKSTVSDDEEQLQRNFTYEGQKPTLTPTPSPTTGAL